MSTTAPEGREAEILPDDLVWRGYRRKDGRVGARNLLVVLSTVALTDRLAQEICFGNDGAVCVAGAFSRGLQNQDEETLFGFIQGVASHPNVGGILLVTHDRQAMQSLKANLCSPEKTRFLAFMACGGRHAAVEAGRTAVLELSREMKSEERQDISFADLRVALECGGSDVSSNICSNPVVGLLSDSLAHAGGTIIVSETAEFIGAEKIFDTRCPDGKTRNKILDFIGKKEKLMDRDSGRDYRGVNPTNENIEGGLTTLIEKSMGAVSKTGTSDFVSALGFGQNPAEAGLHFMDTPFFSPTSLTGMMLGGCTLCLFTMGVYNPSGNPLCPTLKVCGNPKTLSHWSDQIDLDVSPYFLGEETKERAFVRLLKEVNLVFNGKRTVAEKCKEGQFILPRTREAL